MRGCARGVREIRRSNPQVSWTTGIEPADHEPSSNGSRPGRWRSPLDPRASATNNHLRLLKHACYDLPTDPGEVRQPCTSPSGKLLGPWTSAVSAGPYGRRWLSYTHTHDPPCGLYLPDGCPKPASSRISQLTQHHRTCTQRHLAQGLTLEQRTWAR